jgi:hypothetical protein
MIRRNDKTGDGMTVKLVVASALATCLAANVVQAQAMMPVPYGGARPAPVPQSPVADPRDTPEEIAKDSARDLSDDHFYNRPGATRASYDAAWQRCRLIARGSRTPSGSIPYSYNPALVSPIAAGIGGGIGGLIGGAIVEGQQRRANRRNCLLIDGWRMIEVPPATAARLKTMTDDQRATYFNRIVGATQVDGAVTERKSFTQPVDPVFNLDAPVFGPGSVFLGKKIDPKIPFVLAPGEAAVVLAFRRPDALSAGRSALVQLARYDVAGRDLLYRRKDWKKTGDKTVYDVAAGSADRKAPYEVQVIRVTPGDYVIASTAVVAKIPTASYCFGAPTFHVDPGAVVYLGDFIPVVNGKLRTGETVSTLAYATHIDDARRTLTSSQPALGASLRPARMFNRATYACSAITMDRWDVPGADPLPPAAALTANSIAQ